MISGGLYIQIPPSSLPNRTSEQHFIGGKWQDEKPNGTWARLVHLKQPRWDGSNDVPFLNLVVIFRFIHQNLAILQTFHLNHHQKWPYTMVIPPNPVIKLDLKLAIAIKQSTMNESICIFPIENQRFSGFSGKNSTHKFWPWLRRLSARLCGLIKPGSP